MARNLIFIIIFGILVPNVYALDWNIYGSMRLKSFYETVDGDYNSAKNNKDEGRSTDLDFALQNNSRVGINGVHENLSSQLELGLNSGLTDITLRIFKIAYDFGNIQLMMGHDFTPLDVGISGQVFDTDNALNGIGTAWEVRQDQIRMTTHGFQFLLVKPAKEGAHNIPGIDSDADSEDYLFPKVEIGFTFEKDEFIFKPFGGIQATRLKYYQSKSGDTYGNKKEETILAYLAGVVFEWSPEQYYVKWSGSYAVNSSNLGQVDYANAVTATAVFVGTRLTDTTTIQSALVAGYKFNNTIKLELGAGYRDDEFDSSVSDIGWREDTQTTISYYAQTVIALPVPFKETLPLTPVAYIVPEIGYVDYGKNPTSGESQGDKWYAGAKWQMDF